MRTQAQIEASRRNGAQSSGPVTAEGKARASLNHTLHGLAGSTIVLEGESEEKFEILLAECIDELKPETALERELVDEIAAARWRLRRSRAIETSMLNKHIARQRGTVESAYENADYPLRHETAMESANLPLIHRYETRISRSHDRAMKNFEKLRAMRRKFASEKQA
jgi:hypothetical protein